MILSVGLPLKAALRLPAGRKPDCVMVEMEDFVFDIFAPSPRTSSLRFCVEGTDDYGMLSVNGRRPPFFVFDVERQDYVAGPFWFRWRAAQAARRRIGTMFKSRGEGRRRRLPRAVVSEMNGARRED